MADIIEFDFSNIIVDEKKFRNSRATYSKLDELSNSIRSSGLLQPVVVWECDKSKYFLIIGFRRYKAIELIRKKNPDAFAKIPVSIFKGTEQDARLANMIENLQREDLTHAEEAEGYQELVRLGMPVVDIASKAGVSAPWVSKLLAIRQKAHPAVFRALHEDRISVTVAADLIALKMEEQENHLSNFIQAENIPTKEVRTRKKREARDAVKQAAAETTGRASARPGVKKLKKVLEQVSEKVSNDDSQFYIGVQKGILLSLGEILEIRKP